MRKSLLFFIIGWLHALLCPNSPAQNSWNIELAPGDAFCLPAPLSVQQSGYPAIHIHARYATNSFKLPIYYSVKVGKWKGGHGWELELIHLKIELKNKRAEIQRFEISHGFNLLTINQAWDIGNFIFQFGGGIIVAHPENTVRNQKLSENKGILNKGYYIAGPTIQFAVSRKLVRLNHFSVMIQGKLTGSYGRVPIANGHANVTTVAIHGLMGLEYNF
jgi:hypothetical protein